MKLVIAPRTTIKKDVIVEGKGLHSGLPVKLRIRPGSNGIGFIPGGQRIHACSDAVIDTRRSTTLGLPGNDAAKVRTVEHLMSALTGLGLTDVEIEITGPELPGLDGSAKEFCDALIAAGRVEIGDRVWPVLFKRVFVQEGDASIGISAGTGHWRFEYAAGDGFPRTQVFETTDVSRDYVTEIAPARTFALEEEVPHLAGLGLGQGLDESSAVIVGKGGYVNEARYEDELARHKLLDLIGDIGLTGCPIGMLNVVAVKSGHTLHVAAAKKLLAVLESENTDWQA